LVGGLVLSFAALPAHAQRPSFGGLIQQVDGMLDGGVPFTTVAFGDGRCSIGIDPTGELTALIEKDPVGFRLMGDATGGGMRLLFGPTMDCTIEVQPSIVQGLLLRDPIIRIWPPVPPDPDPPIAPRLLFGPTDLCEIMVDPVLGGMRFSDPAGFVFQNPRGEQPVVTIPRGVLEFGPDCSIGIDPQLTGIVEKDPGGLRLLGLNGQGCILTFGPTDMCRILVDPLRETLGLIFTDPKRFSFISPAGEGEAMVDVDGIVTAAGFETRSSRRLKENIRPIDNALEAVKKLRGVRFNWKKEVQKSGGTDLGFVAEEVAEVVSEAAVYDQDHNATGIKYGNLVALAVEGIKAQQQQIDAQQKLIEELQREIAALRDEK
jgi:hypothetical protein